MNEFKLKGKVVAIDVVEAGKLARMSVEVIANQRTEVIPVMAFNKLSMVVTHYTRVGTVVEVSGALRWNYRIKAVEPIAFKITEIEQMDTKNAQKVTKSDKKRTVIDKKESKKEIKVASGTIKKIDPWDGLIVNVYENLSQAAEEMKVKKSALKKAIENGTRLAGYKWSR